jgi:NADH dehydrogenase FAD-containing subunit
VLALEEVSMQKILIVGGGYGGFPTAWKLETKLRTDEASVTLVDPRPYMTYQPLLPEVAAGSIEARHVAVSLRRHRPHTHLIIGSVVHIDHAHRRATVRPVGGTEQELQYDTIVITAGAVTRTSPTPGAAARSRCRTPSTPGRASGLPRTSSPTCAAAR